jgi:hypothetical protein
VFVLALCLLCLFVFPNNKLSRCSGDRIEKAFHNAAGGAINRTFGGHVYVKTNKQTNSLVDFCAFFHDYFVCTRECRNNAAACFKLFDVGLSTNHLLQKATIGLQILKSDRNGVFFHTVNVCAVYNTGTTSPRISSTRAGDTPTATSKGITPGAWSGFTPRRAAQETSTGCCPTTFITSGEHCALAPAQRPLA